MSPDHKDTARATTKRIRKNPVARRAEIISTAREVFAASGYAEAGVADVARAANVSKGLLYHYFPSGRPDLLVSVLEELVAEFLEQLRRAARVPFSASVRMTHLLGEVFGFFDDNPTAYRLLFRDPWGTHDEKVETTAVAIRAQIASELASVMASSSAPPEDLVAASSGILGFALANVELCLTDQLDPEVAWRVTCEYATTHLAD